MSTAPATDAQAPERLTKSQRMAILASYLGWTLDAFDFFLMVFMVKAISEAFGSDVKSVSEALFFTLAAKSAPRVSPLKVIAQNWRLALYLILLMTAFNFFSHGTQDTYPTFLQKQHHFDTQTTGLITGIMNVGAIIGAFFFGTLSESLGRRRTIMLAALLALPIIPLWAFSTTALYLALGAFLIQACVQGAWAVVPAYLNEMSPPAIRAMFPGFVYQLGNLIASRNAPMQASIAQSHGDNFGLALAWVAGVTALVLAGWSMLGPERRGEKL